MPTVPGHLAVVPFVSVDHMMQLVLAIGPERFIVELADYLESDFRRWPAFDKTPRVASHSKEGVIELMPAADDSTYAFKYVNGHPSNTRRGRQTVTAFGVLADVATGYPLLLTEMTILTALRTAATSAMAAKHLAPKGARTMAIIGNGAQSEFQAIGFKVTDGLVHFFLRLVILTFLPVTEGKIPPDKQGNNSQNSEDDLWILFNPMFYPLHLFRQDL